jgi:hypothetical protein
MHKLVVSLRKVARSEEATVETIDATSGDEELVFLVGPRAAGFAVDQSSHSRSVLQKLSADR